MRCSICLNDKDTVFWAIRGHTCDYCLNKLRRRRLGGSHEPLPEFTGPEKVWGEHMFGIAIAIFDSQLLGLRCAKVKYGVDAVSEIVNGYFYEDTRGRHIMRITSEEESEDEQCSGCLMSIWACNAMEIVV